MKLYQLLTTLPAIALLSACSQTPVNISGNNAGNLVGANLTATPTQLVVYPNDRPSIADGADTFKESCASCHGAEGSGGTANVKFDAQWADSTKPVDIYRLVAFGGSDPSKPIHPAFADKLTYTQLWNCVVYARSIGQPALSDDEMKAIDPVFGSNCAVCHGTKGDGDPGNLGISRNLEPAPANFTRYDRFFNRSDDTLFDHIANGIRWEAMPNFLGKVDRKKNVHFDEAYIRKLVQYVRHFQISKAPFAVANSQVSPPSAGGTETGTGSGSAKGAQ